MKCRRRRRGERHRRFTLAYAVVSERISIRYRTCSSRELKSLEVAAVVRLEVLVNR